MWNIYHFARVYYCKKYMSRTTHFGRLFIVRIELFCAFLGIMRMHWWTA